MQKKLTIPTCICVYRWFFIIIVQRKITYYFWVYRWIMVRFIILTTPMLSEYAVNMCLALPTLPNLLFVCFISVLLIQQIRHRCCDWPEVNMMYSCFFWPIPKKINSVNYLFSIQNITFVNIDKREFTSIHLKKRIVL